MSEEIDKAEIAGFGQTRNLTMDDVIIALQNIGLGSKLVNMALIEMGYVLIVFPEPNNPSTSLH